MTPRADSELFEVARLLRFRHEHNSFASSAGSKIDQLGTIRVLRVIRASTG